MRTAKIIVQEYLERGYSMESLRVLADSRDEPLRSEMLALLKTRNDIGAAEAACESAPVLEDGAVFFVADDDESAADEGFGIDFNLMSASEPEAGAADEESVDDVLGELADEESVADVLGELANEESVVDVPAEADVLGENDAQSEETVELAVGNTFETRAVSSESGSDYLPGLAADRAPEAVVVEPAPVMSAIPATVSEGAAIPLLMGEVKESRRERRRRERARKKQEKRARKERDDIAAGLPEIVRTRAEDVDTMTPAAEEGMAQQAVEHIEHVEAPESADAPEPILSLEANENAEPEEMTESADAPEPVLSLEINENAEPEEMTESADAPEPILSLEANENAEPEEMAESADALEPVLSLEINESAEPEEMTESADALEPVLSLEENENAEPEEMAESADAPEPVLSLEANENVEPEEMAESADAPEPALSLEASENAEPEEMAESADAPEPVLSLEINENAEPEEMAESTDAPEPVLSLEASENGEPEEMAESADEPGQQGISARLTLLDTVGESEDESASEAGREDREDGWIEDYAMIVSGGGYTLRQESYDLLAEEDGAGDESEEEASGGNVILFRNDMFASGGGDDADGSEEYAPPVLRMLTLSAGDEEEPAAEETAEPVGGSPDREMFTPIAQLDLLRAIAGCSGAEECAAEAEAADDHVIVAMDLYGEPVDLAAALAEERGNMEREHQARLDEFAQRLLLLRQTAAESERRVREKDAALETKNAELAQLQARCALEGEERGRLDEELKRARDEIVEREVRLGRFSGMREEHEKLYNEFEDLRKAYNEVVTDVMPGLQKERDELALTIDRQVDEEDRLRGSLKAARKKLAVGYSMGAAACLMLLALPAANWLRADGDAREFVMDRQRLGELSDRVDLAERRNVKAGETIAELERKLNLAAIELAKLEEKNGEMSRRGRELAAGTTVTVRSDGGTPTRASAMALQAAPNNGVLRVNEVRDPAGSIEQVYADNRSRRRADEGPQMAARGGAPARIPVSAVATGRQSGANGSGVRPPAANSAAARQARPDEVLAKVRAGEGVAQVVYRVLGTRDPGVIDWVIRENGIKKDRRGNPRIYPDQELRLPQRAGQSDSVARR